MCFKINQSICSDLEEFKVILGDILQKINKVIRDDSTMFDIRIILNELVANGVIHGNCEDKNKFVNVCVNVYPNFIKIEVKDEGEGFIYNKDRYNPMELKCNGRGLVLVEGLSDEFYIQKNKVVSIKYL
ncbi:ATP-binding protein [Caldisalinibacter kiritimatiensis]|uniref:Histidine kinase/HSP90-like ATPase domain-containing protein n=1 Tax=Caldisalinibacter kiritimatiensis TaxID=1304284 RepID=R1CV28_9FIRM|nr:ATP-binding protein [Caldisalinibacter kiritimatiensis]EOD00484.1 hypothetical protein L21TH_1463 [Caldisalinibacter kiritimatiensis]